MASSHNSKSDPKKAEMIEKLQKEKSSLEKESNPEAMRLLDEEMGRIQTGKGSDKLVELHQPKPTKLTVKVLIPVKYFPKYNFVGKLLGPGGSSLKQLQEDTGTKMFILGRGSMKDKAKEEELRKEGGKFHHLSEELHVQVDAFGLPSEVHQRMAHALGELQRFLIPDENDDMRHQHHGQQMDEMMYLNGDNPSRGRGRGRGMPPGPPPSRGRGGPPPNRGRGGPPSGPPGGSALLATPSGRGAPRGGPIGRGAPPSRAAPGGRVPMGRPAPPSRAPPPARAAPPPARETSYDPDPYYQQSSTSYAEDSYNHSSTDQYSSDPYTQSSYSSTAQETEYYDYGHGSSADDAAYGDSWAQTASSYDKAPVSRPRSSEMHRSHPYSASSLSSQRTSRY